MRYCRVSNVFGDWYMYAVMLTAWNATTNEQVEMSAVEVLKLYHRTKKGRRAGTPAVGAADCLMQRATAAPCARADIAQTVNEQPVPRTHVVGTMSGNATCKKWLIV